MNVFDEKKKAEEEKFQWADTGTIRAGRMNLGEEMPVQVYRLFQYAVRESLAESFGKEKMAEIFRSAGAKAGKAFAGHMLDLNLEFNEFMAQLQQSLKDMKIGVLRMEQYEEDTGHAILTFGEDLDCSGIPVTGETICNYNEGFIAGIFNSYTRRKYMVREIDCWATGVRVCRFEATVCKDKTQTGM